MTRPFAVTLIVFMAATSPALAQSEAEQRQACTGDAFKFCSAAIPNREKVSACLATHRAELSPACRAMVGGNPPGPRPARRG